MAKSKRKLRSKNPTSIEKLLSDNEVKQYEAGGYVLKKLVNGGEDDIVRPHGDSYEYKKVGDKYYTRKREGEWDSEVQPDWNLASGEAENSIKYNVFKEEKPKPAFKKTLTRKTLTGYNPSDPSNYQSRFDAEFKLDQSQDGLKPANVNSASLPLLNLKTINNGVDPDAGYKQWVANRPLNKRAPSWFDKNVFEPIGDLYDDFQKTSLGPIDDAANLINEVAIKPIVTLAKDAITKPEDLAKRTLQMVVDGVTLLPDALHEGIRTNIVKPDAKFNTSVLGDPKSLELAGQYAAAFTTMPAVLNAPKAIVNVASKSKNVVPVLAAPVKQAVAKVDKIVWPKKAYRVRTASGKKNLDYSAGQKVSAKEQELLAKIEKKGEWYTDDIEEVAQYAKGNESRAGIFQGDDMVIDEVKIPFWNKNKNVTTNKDVVALKKEQGFIVDGSAGSIYAQRINPNEFIIPKKSIFYPKKSTTIKAMPDEVANKPAMYTLGDGKTQVNVSNTFRRNHPVMDPPKGNETYLTKPYQYLDEQIEGATGINPKTFEGVDDVAKVAKTTKKLKDPFKSEINWGKWNKEIPNDKALMDEYLTIETNAKANGTWMKNADGTKYQGTPEQFIQQRSKNFKAAFPDFNINDPWAIQFRGQGKATETIGGGDRVNWDGVSFLGDKKQAMTYAVPEKGRSIIGGKHSGKIYKPGTNPQGSLHELYVPKGSNSKVINNKTMTNWQNLKDKDVLADLNAGLPLGAKSSVRHTTDDVANYVVKNNLDDVKITNLDDYGYDPRLDEWFTKYLEKQSVGANTTIFNSKPGRYLKSTWYNNGKFDMTNPSQYKAIVPLAVGAALTNEKGGEIRSLTNSQVEKYKLKGYIVKEY